MMGFRHALLVAVAAASPTAAAAGLEICNDTSALQAVAIAYVDNGTRVSEGWWAIPPGACRLPVAWDLQQGFVYLFAKSPGWVFRQDGISFCTTSRPFTITGVGDCAANGYDSADFLSLPVGEADTYLRINLSDYMSFDPVKEDVFSADDAVFQGCIAPPDGEPLQCAFHSHGTKFFVRDNGRTPAPVLSFLRQLEAGAPLRVAGTLAVINDTTAEVVLQDAQRRQAGSSDDVLAHMQGSWVSDDDPAERLTILGAERYGTYGDRVTGTEFLSVQDRCDGYEGDGLYLYARDEQSGDGLCYGIESITDTEMSLIHLPRGNLLFYRKAE